MSAAAGIGKDRRMAGALRRWRKAPKSPHCAVSALPPNRITFTEVPAGVCAVCGNEWWQDHPVPTVYTVASIEAALPVESICDHCVEQHDPDLFAGLLADRQRFRSS